MDKSSADELDEVLREFTNLTGCCKKGERGWSKYKGDVCARLLVDHMRGHLGPGLKVVGPNVYLEGYPTEFDLMIVRADSEPIRYTAAHRPRDVAACIEVKSRGVYGGREQLRKAVGDLRKTFETITKKSRHIRCAYVTMRERCHVKRQASINYFVETTKYLDPYPVYCFQDSRPNGEVRSKDWADFVKFLGTLRPPASS
jgi:hypothetical protein